MAKVYNMFKSNLSKNFYLFFELKYQLGLSEKNPQKKMGEEGKYNHKESSYIMKAAISNNNYVKLSIYLLFSFSPPPPLPCRHGNFIFLFIVFKIMSWTFLSVIESI